MKLCDRFHNTLAIIGDGDHVNFIEVCRMYQPNTLHFETKKVDENDFVIFILFEDDSIMFVHWIDTTLEMLRFESITQFLLADNNDITVMDRYIFSEYRDELKERYNEKT